MPNEKLVKAKKAKFDEFYTLYDDIQYEVNAYLEYNPDVFKNKTILLPCDDPEWSNFTRFFAQNFERFGLKKLISTSFAFESKKDKWYQLTMFEELSPKFDKLKTKSHGKIFTLTKDKNNSKKIDINDLEWNYLKGDGDFRSDEVKKLRDEADIIVTNPPFSLFSEFLNWILEANKQFLIIGNKSVVGWRDIFPLFKDNKIWSGKTEWSGGLWFETKHPYDIDKIINGINMKNVPSACFTSIEHGRRHTPINLMTMSENLKFSKHKDIRKNGYKKYDNFDAIEVNYYDAIPSDYNGIMGVAITFLDKYCPEQFEIIALGNSRENFMPNKDYINPKKIMKDGSIHNGGAINCVLAIETDEKPTDQIYYISDNSKYLIAPYTRILIRRKKS